MINTETGRHECFGFFMGVGKYIIIKFTISDILSIMIMLHNHYHCLVP